MLTHDPATMPTETPLEPTSARTDTRDRLRGTVALNLALAELIPASGTRTESPHRPGSLRAESAVRRVVAKATASTAAEVLPAAAAGLAPLVSNRVARLLTAHLNLVSAIAQLRGWDLAAPSTQTLARLALARVRPAEVATLLFIDLPVPDPDQPDSQADPPVLLTPASITARSQAQLWSANRYAALVILRSYAEGPEPTTLQVALAALELFGPAD